MLDTNGDSTLELILVGTDGTGFENFAIFGCEKESIFQIHTSNSWVPSVQGI